MEKTIPFSVYAESTPNPRTMKFVANRVLLAQGLAEYTSLEEAIDSPVATQLFQFPFVTAVFIQQNFITVMKSDMVPWEEVVMEIRVFIRDLLNSGVQVQKEQPSGTSEDRTQMTEGHQAPSNQLEEKIIHILDTEVAPAVAQDGGSITFKAFEDGVLNVVLRGACSGCPSSTMTLKSGIETLLKKRLPGEIKEVVAFNG